MIPEDRALAICREGRYRVYPSSAEVAQAIVAALDELQRGYEEAMEREGINKYRREHVHDIAEQLMGASVWTGFVGRELNP